MCEHPPRVRFSDARGPQRAELSCKPVTAEIHMLMWQFNQRQTSQQRLKDCHC
jgi:hypothetical protein